jgi:choline-glycine betaine transporter
MLSIDPYTEPKEPKWHWSANIFSRFMLKFKAILMAFTLLNPPASYLPRKFPQTFSNTSQALLSVAFNFILKSWSSNSCLWTNENSFFHIGFTCSKYYSVCFGKNVTRCARKNTFQTHREIITVVVEQHSGWRVVSVWGFERRGRGIRSCDNILWTFNQTYTLSQRLN